MECDVISLNLGDCSMLTWCIRFRAEMWSKVAKEMGIPWRAVEAMHWHLGEQEMAHRAGVTPFSRAQDPLRTTTDHVRPFMRWEWEDFTSSSRQLPSCAELLAGVPVYQDRKWQE